VDDILRTDKIIHCQNTCRVEVRHT